MMRAATVLALLTFAGWTLYRSEDDAPPDDPPPFEPNDAQGCVKAELRATKTVNVSGKVVDFATGAPVAGAVVDITTAWDVTGQFPLPACAPLAVATTAADGSFGPIAVRAGSSLNPSFMMFLVHGGGRAQTASDLRSCAEERCNMFISIAAPTAAQAAAWRSELAAGGMPDAATRGLVAFFYRNIDGTPAEGVEVTQDFSTPMPLVRGREVRYLGAGADAATVLPVAQTATSASGVALIGLGSPGTPDKAIFVGGRRGTGAWQVTGCLEEPGWIFLEDKIGGP